MEDSYKGDSLGKKFSRLWFWSYALDITCGPKKEPTKRVREPTDVTVGYLASREGGDAGVLLALGVKPENQTAIDMNQSAIESFRKKYPTIRSIVGDARSVLNHRLNLDVVYLDLCNNLTETVIDTVVDCIHSVRPSIPGKSGGGLVALTYKRGREQNFDDISHFTNRKNWKTRSGTGVLTGASDKTLDGRQDFLFTRLNSKLLQQKMWVVPRLVLLYSSRTIDSPGSPMTTVLLQPMRTANMGESFNTVQLRQAITSAVTMPCRNRQDRNRREGKGYKLGTALGHMYDFTKLPLSPVASVRLLDHMIKSGAVHGEYAAQALNVDAATLAAWRAHSTRGTYDKDLSAVVSTLKNNKDPYVGTRNI